jgi:hypothetical protein
VAIASSDANRDDEGLTANEDVDQALKVRKLCLPNRSEQLFSTSHG